MKHIFELDENDIKRIIAKEFNAQANQVTVFTKRETHGHGRRNEYEQTVVYVKVEKIEE